MNHKRKTTRKKSKPIKVDQVSSKHHSVDLTDQVMGQILTDKVKMKPRSYFIAGSILMALGLAVFFILAVFFFNHFFFHFFRTGLIDFWRMRGFSHILWEVFPWWSLVLAAVFIALGAWLIHQYDIAYKKNYKFLVLILIIAAAFFGYVLNLVGVNHLFMKQRVMHHLYERKYVGQDWLVGEIVKLDPGSNLVSVKVDDTLIQVLVSPQTRMPRRQLEVGQTVRVVGEFVDQDKNLFKASILSFGPKKGRWR